MSTNFYWHFEGFEPVQIELPTGVKIEMSVDGINRDDPRIHIGKRGAAGFFCYDCKTTLRKGGPNLIHMGRGCNNEWYDACPKCGKKYAPHKGICTAAAIELGFSPPRIEPPKGVHSTCSFAWAQDPEGVKKICAGRPNEQLITDEYGRMSTCLEFIKMLEVNCMIQFHHLIGQGFS